VKTLKKNSGAIKASYAIILAIIITGAVVGSAVWYFTKPAQANVLEIYHWWTSGGEASAINALVAVYQHLYPNVTVIQSPVAGGAGYVFKSVIKPLVLAGQAPDAFQVHAGYEVQPYVSGGYLDPINDLWSAQSWDNVFPSVIRDMVNFSGNYYAVPVDIHRPNVVWYNKHILDANGINPANITTWDTFFAACDKLALNTTLTSPVALGDSGTWAATHVLEQIMVSEGIPFYQSFINGNMTSSTNSLFLDALTKFSRYINYTNPNHTSLTWDQATALVYNGYCAFNIMGDWANGEFIKANKIYGTDYGTFPVPGTSNDYGLVVDCFEHPKGVRDPQNSLNWLTVVGSADGQMAFNPLKGSIPARTDLMNNATDVLKFNPYQQAAIYDFQHVTYIYPSIVHGSAMPESFTSTLDVTISTLVAAKGHDSTSAISTAASSITGAITSASSYFVKTWKLY
jgi:glucose/mannose transport system substrate-binding protein